MNFANKIMCLAGLSLLCACESGRDDAAQRESYGNIPSIEDSELRGSAAEFITNAGDRVFFAYDTSSLEQEGSETLRRQAEWLKVNPAYRVLIEGHCDERGTREYNIGLGERRADAAAKFLESNGVDGSRIRTISYGKDRPISSEGTQEEINRVNRVAISVIER